MAGVRAVVDDVHVRRLLMARGVSMFGSSLAPIALAFAVLGVRGRSVGDLGVVLFARVLAQLIFVLYGGVLADRMSRRQLMIVADLVAGLSQMVLGGVFVAATRGAHVELVVVLALTFVNGAASAMFQPASDGLLPLMLAPDLLQSAQAMLQVVINAATILGAGVGGLLVAAVGPGWALLVDAATYFVSAALLLGMRTGSGGSAHPDTISSTVLSDLRHGWHEFVSRQWVWVVVVLYGVMNFCLSGGVFVLGPIIAARELGGASAWAVIIVAQGVGFVLGSLLGLKVRPAHPLLAFVLLTFAVPPVFLLLALHAPLWSVAAAMLVEGLVVELSGVLWMSVFFARIPQEMMSRIGSYDVIASMALVPLGFAAIGPIAGYFGERRTLVTYFVVVVLTTVAALLSRALVTVTAQPEPVQVTPPQ